jgi:uncharacterized protein YcnI
MIRKLLVTGAIVAGVVALGAGTAFAHVEIEREGEVGSDGTVNASLTVPNEEPDAGTVRVELVFPDSPGLTEAEAEPVEGWTATVEKSADGDVESVSWTGGPLTGEEKVDLPISLGPVPEGTDEIDFTALQTYDDGQVVRWVDPTPEGGEEPEHPAPVLLISGEPEEHEATTTSESHDDDSGLSTGAIIAIIVAVIIVIVLIVWLVRRRRSSTSTV